MRGIQLAVSLNIARCDPSACFAKCTCAICPVPFLLVVVDFFAGFFDFFPSFFFPSSLALFLAKLLSHIILPSLSG